MQGVAQGAHLQGPLAGEHDVLRAAVGARGGVPACEAARARAQEHVDHDVVQVGRAAGDPLADDEQAQVAEEPV